MARVFISYSHADLGPVRQLEQGLLERGVSVWRDQEKIYTGDKWPKALGEAIAANDFLLLVWSKNAAGSEYVELEWCSAIALKKTILPCLLDDTPLPPSLRSIQGINAREPAGALLPIVQSLERGVREADPAHSTEVIKKLGEIPSREPREVLQAAKTLFDQREWTIHGSVYQAARDIHVTTVAAPPGKAEKTLLERWQTWVALLIGLSTLITVAIELPQKVIQMIRATSDVESTQDDPVLAQPLSGSIRDEDNDPLPGVRVSLPKFGLTTTTDDFGQFHFEVSASKQASVAIMAQKGGYATYEADATLGNTNLSFSMRKKK